MLKELLKYYIKSPKFKYLFLYLCICLFIYPFENIGVSILNSKIFPLLGKPESNKLLVYAIILFVTVYSFKIIKDYSLINITPYITNSIRKSYFENILKKYKKNFEYTKNGELLNKLILVPDLFRDEVVKDLIENALPQTFGIIFSMVFLYKIDKTIVKYILFMLIPIIIILVSLNKNVGITLNYFNERSIQLDFFSENITNLFNIYITNSIDNNLLKHKNITNKLLNSYNPYIIFDSTFTIFSKIIYLIVTILVIIKIKHNFISKTYDYSTVILLLTNLIMVLRNCVNIILILYFSIRTYSSLEILTGNILNKNIDGTKQIDINMIQFNNITFKYPKTQSNILENMNLDIKLGDKVVIFGKSGSGKSTIFKLLMGFFSPINGKILVNDSNVNDLDLTYYRNQFAYIGQDTKLFDMSVMDNIKYSINTTNEEVYALMSKYKINRIYEKLEKGLETNAGTDGNNLSGGQKQMVLILRALLKKPKIYLFDEPTAALDPNTGKIIYTILRDINETTLVISHDINIKDYFPIVYNLEDKGLVKEK